MRMKLLFALVIAAVAATMTLAPVAASAGDRAEGARDERQCQRTNHNKARKHDRQDRTRQDRTRQDRTRQDRTKKDAAAGARAQDASAPAGATAIPAVVTTAVPATGAVPAVDFKPATTPYTGPMTIRSGNQPDGGLILRGFEISGSLTIDAGNLPYIIIAGNHWHIPSAPGKAVRILSSSGDIQVYGNRFDGLQADGSTVVGDVVAINSPQATSKAEVYENLFVDIGSGGGAGSAAHTDLIVTFNAEMNVRNNRFARISGISSAIFYQSIQGPTWGVVEGNIVEGNNHLIRAQSRKPGAGDLIVRNNTLNGPVSWIDPSWEGNLVWVGNSSPYVPHAA